MRPSGLDGLLTYQQADQLDRYGISPADFPPGVLMEYVREQVLGALHELHEALDECGWKPWKADGRGIMNRPAMLLELADVQVFLTNLVVATGAGPDEWDGAVLATTTKNARRRAEGY